MQSVIDTLNNDAIPDLIPVDPQADALLVDALIKTVDLSPSQLAWLMLCHHYAVGGSEIADRYIYYCSRSNVSLRKSLIDALNAISLKDYVRGIADRLIGGGGPTGGISR